MIKGRLTDKLQRKWESCLADLILFNEKCECKYNHYRG